MVSCCTVLVGMRCSRRRMSCDSAACLEIRGRQERMPQASPPVASTMRRRGPRAGLALAPPDPAASNAYFPTLPAPVVPPASLHPPTPPDCRDDPALPRHGRSEPDRRRIRGTRNGGDAIKGRATRLGKKGSFLPRCSYTACRRRWRKGMKEKKEGMGDLLTFFSCALWLLA